MLCTMLKIHESWNILDVSTFDVTLFNFFLSVNIPVTLIPHFMVIAPSDRLCITGAYTIIYSIIIINYNAVS